MQKITPFLWFDNNAEEAIAFYTAVFPNARVTGITRWPAGGPGPEGAVLTAAFNLEGIEFVALNGGPQFRFTEAVSFVINCRDQEEVDYYWEKLTDGGSPSRCGWLRDRFGLSWQVVPVQLTQMLTESDTQKTGRVMQAMMGMDKIIIADLEAAYNQ